MAAIFQIITNENNLYSLGSTCINNPLKSINIGRPVVYSNTISWQDIQFNNTEATNHAHGKNSSYSYFQNTEQVISAIAYALDETKIIRTNYESLGNTYATKTSVTNLSDALNSLVARVAALENATPTPQPTTYTATCNVTNGTLSSNQTQTVTKGHSVSWTINPTDGYEMPTEVEVTTTSGNIVTATISGNTVKVDDVQEDITITVVCTTIPVQTYTVQFNTNGGSGSVAAKTANAGAIITLPSYTGTKTGYTFGGWNTKQDGTGTNYNVNTSYTVNENITLYAKWTINVTRYTITIHPNNGNANSVESYEENSTFEINRISNITRTGYTLLGWSTTENGSEATYNSYGNNAFRVTEDVDLWAVWEENVQYHWYVGKDENLLGKNGTSYNLNLDNLESYKVNSINDIYTNSQSVGDTENNIYVVCPTEWVGQFKLTDLDNNEIPQSDKTSQITSGVTGYSILRGNGKVMDSIIKVVRN